MPRRQVDELRIFEEPKPGEAYVMGGDIAEGLEHGDDSVLQVLSLRTGKQVAEYWLPTTTPPDVGEEALKLGLWYNTAYIGIENNKDLTPLFVLDKARYPNIHRQQDFRPEPGEKQTQKLGWNTNARSRYIMVDDGVKDLRDGLVSVSSPWLLDQMEIFAQNPRGKYEAIPGGHDDLVMAWLIAVQMMKIKLTHSIDKEEPVEAYWNGQPVGAFIEVDEEGRPRTREARIANKQFANAMEDTQAQSTVGNLI